MGRLLRIEFEREGCIKGARKIYKAENRKRQYRNTGAGHGRGEI